MSHSLIRIVPLVTAAACALGMGVTAGADPGPPNFTCDATHHPTDGAVYKNFTAAGCTVGGASFTVTKNVEVTTGLLLNENTHVTVHGNVTVDNETSLYMSGTAPAAPPSMSIDGNVTVTNGDFDTDYGGNGTSFASVRVGGNFTGNGPINVVLGDHSAVAGHTNITAEQGDLILYGGSFGPVSVEDIANPNASVFIADNTVDGSVHLSNDSDFFNLLDANTIRGNLSCSGDSPPPGNQGQPNTVTGSETGQCAGL